MLTAELNDLTSLEDFYREIRSQQEEFHGQGYCAHHDAIQRYAGKQCSYKELGTHQGATAAAAVLAGYKEVTLVDRDHYKLRPNQHLFESYCSKEKIRLEIVESDSTHQRAVSPVDVLLIDSKHTYKHCTSELSKHAKFVGRYIIFHDTSHKKELANAVDDFLKKNTDWKMVEVSTENVGYTVIGRVG